MAASRGIAQRAIADDRVRVGGMPATKAATLVGPGDSIELLGDEIEWAGRGGKKLAGVLGVFGVNPDGTRCLDVGASTGGFTDVLLHHGAAAVTAVVLDSRYSISQNPPNVAGSGIFSDEE